ncbi:kinase-like protein [Colletotrichum falcatum]|nr:kinase-like protein [Colletotrichum falcatum]
MLITSSTPVISDFSATRLGVYRAPEIIISLKWDSKIDIWSVGVMVWDLFEGGRLFRAVKDARLDDEQHLAEMTALLGPPPKTFLELSEKCRRYWDSEGNWIAATSIPDQSFESREIRLKGEEKELLVAFVRKVLRWLPEDRPTAEDLFKDEFLNQLFAIYLEL